MTIFSVFRVVRQVNLFRNLFFVEMPEEGLNLYE